MRRVLLVLVITTCLLCVASSAFAIAKDAYEPDNSLGAAKSIGLSTDVKSTTLQMHTFHRNSDVDYVKISAKKGTTYDLKILGSDQTTKSRWLKASVYRYSSSKKKWYSVVGWTADGSPETHYPFKATTTAKYAIKLRPYGSSGSGTRYGLRVVTDKYPTVTADTHDPTDNVRTAATALVPQASWDTTSYNNSGVYVYNTICAASQLHSISTTSDADWYLLTMPAGHDYHVMFDMGDRTNQTYHVSFTDSVGNPIPSWSLTKTDEFSGISWTSMPATSTYYICVTGNGTSKFWYRIGMFTTP